MAEDMGERSEAPTHKRLEDARGRGQIPRSADLSSALLLFAAVVILAMVGEAAIRGAAGLMRAELGEGIGESIVDPAGARDIFLETTFRGLSLAAPALLLLFLAAFAAQFTQVGWLLSPKPLAPKWSRLNVVKGVGQLFGRRNLVKGVINVFKVSLVAAVTTLVIRAEIEGVLALPGMTVGGGIVFMTSLGLRLALWLLFTLLFLGAVDYAYQRWQHREDLKMTKHEVKDERRSSEGDPEVKGRRMRIARQIAMQRLRTDVPKADVVVTNPTHYAVALKYDSTTMNAPKVVAKGADYLALQIRLIAASSGVPIIERPTLARALYANVEIGREVPADLYEAVAEVLAYVYRLEGRAAS